MLGNSVAVAVVVRTRPGAIPLAMITMRKSTHGFPFLSYMSMELRLAALNLGRRSSAFKGNLRSKLELLKRIGTSKFILNVIEKGYMLPFLSP